LKRLVVLDSGLAVLDKIAVRSVQSVSRPNCIYLPLSSVSQVAFVARIFLLGSCDPPAQDSLYVELVDQVVVLYVALVKHSAVAPAAFAAPSPEIVASPFEDLLYLDLVATRLASVETAASG
jgi:hypothetical protein